MKFEYFALIGLVSNLLMAMLLPTIIMPIELQNTLGIESNSEYNQNSGIISQDQKENVGNTYNVVNNQESQEELFNADGSRSEGLGGTLSSFIDSIGYGLNKITSYASLLIPFGTLLFNLPGVLGYFVGVVWSFMFILTTINWVRNR